MTYRLFICIIQLIYASDVYTKILAYKRCFCVEVVENGYRMTQMQFDSTWTSILRQIDVNLMSVCMNTEIKIW